MDAVVVPLHRDGAADTTPASDPPSGGDNRPPVYVEADGTVVYRASSLGSCIRSLVAHRNQVASPRPHSAQMMERFAEGIAAEPQIIAFLGTQGWDVTDAGDSQAEYDLEVLPGVVVRCHPDGLAARRGEPRYTSERVVEAKALSDSLADKGLYALSHYPWQLSIEMLATGRKALYVVYNKKYDTVDGASTVIKEIDTPPYTLAQIKARIAKVEIAAAAERQQGGDLPDCNQRDFPCQWFGVLCQHHLEKAPAVVDDDPDAFERLCLDLASARVLAKDAKLSEEAARERLMAAMGERERVQGGRYIAQRVVYKTTRFDRRRLEEERPEVAAEYVTESESVRLDVKELGE